MTPEVTLIIPVYNRPLELSRALRSVFAQTHLPNEIIIVDDASTDSTPEVLAHYEDQIRIIRLPDNRGVSAARNIGINAAKSEWIALLDSDDEWLPDKLEKQLKYLKLHPELSILQSEEIWIRNGKRVNAMKKHQKYAGDIFKESLPLCIVSPSAVLFKRSLFLELGAFDENLAVCEDYDLWLRWSLKHRFGLLKEAGIIKYGGHEDQLSRKYWGMDRFRLRSLHKLLSNSDLDMLKRKDVLEEMNAKLNIYLLGLKKREKRDQEFEEMKLFVDEEREKDNHEIHKEHKNDKK